jgi:hypothetical protein
MPLSSYKCTSPEVGRLSPVGPVTGEGNFDSWAMFISFSWLSINILTRVLFPAPVREEVRWSALGTLDKMYQWNTNPFVL